MGSLETAPSQAAIHRWMSSGCRERHFTGSGSKPHLRCAGGDWPAALLGDNRLRPARNRRPRPDRNGPVVSKWLTAEGLVEDNKTVVILPLPHVALVVPAQPVETPVVVAVTVVHPAAASRLTVSRLMLRYS